LADRTYVVEVQKLSIFINIIWLSVSLKTYGVMDINPPKCNAIDYINFLIAASNVFRGDKYITSNFQFGN